MKKNADANPIAEGEARARELVKTILPALWKLRSMVCPEYFCCEWEDFEDSEPGTWGAALYSMGDALCRALDLNEIGPEIADAETWYYADRIAEKRARAARRAARKKAANAAKGNG